MKKSVILGILFCFCNLLIHAEVWTIESVPNTRLQDARVYVSNPDGLIDAQSQAEINSLLATVEKNLTAEIFVVALKSIGDVQIKEFATALFNKWGIGKKSKSNGLLMLFVEDQRKVTFESGEGMEGVLPDALCKRILHNEVTPFMRQGKYGEGLLSGVKSIMSVLSDPKVATEIMADTNAEKAVKAENNKDTLFNILLIYLVLSIVVLVLSSRGIRKKIKQSAKQDPYSIYKILVTSKTGYGILAVIFPLTMVFFYIFYKREIKKYRKMPRLCSKCGKQLTLMTEQQEDAYLNAGQQEEEIVGSVDYDAWICLDCGNRLFLPYANTFTKYQTCPACGFRTFSQTKDRILFAPTPLSSGEGERVYSCANCNHEEFKRYTIPMIVVIPTGGGNNNSGFGGGGFGGGSFGGGMSGGGGASDGW
jgi:uncharacterized protein